MLLRAQAIGREPCIRFVILRLDGHELKFWNGIEFTHDLDSCQKHYTPSDACFEIQDILKTHYERLPVRKFVVPVEIDVYGDITKRDIAKYLHRASILSIRTEEFGNGPIEESYVAPVIHWGYLREITGPIKEQMDELAADWDSGDEINFGDP